MERLNYQHLLYVWMTAREGTVARAAEQLRLAPSTLSGQIHSFEDVLGEKLFARRGRRLELTEAGRIAFGYADEIFSLGQEFLETLHGQTAGRPVRVVVGLLDVLPKPMVQRILDPVFAEQEDIRIVCREDRSLDGFLSELAVYGVDMVLSDAPASPSRYGGRSLSMPSFHPPDRDDANNRENIDGIRSIHIPGPKADHRSRIWRYGY